MVIIKAKKIVKIGEYKIEVKVVDTLTKNRIRVYAKIICKKK